MSADKNINPEHRAGENMLASFDETKVMAGLLVGSCVSNSLERKSDIDIFLCLEQEPTTRELQNFHKAYFAEHVSLGRIPDYEYPGEVMSLSKLALSLHKTKSAIPSATLNDPVLYDGIVWAGMLSGERIELVSPATEMKPYEAISLDIVKRWSDALRLDRLNIPADKLLKQLVTYER